MLKKCIRCKKEFDAKSKNHKYCTDFCKVYSKEKIPFFHNSPKRGAEKRKCSICGNLFSPMNKQHSFCSDKCRISVRTGLNLVKPLVREYFLERANFCCEECKAENENNLELHHDIPLYKGGEDSPSNIVVLCTKCHLKRHKIL